MDDLRRAEEIATALGSRVLGQDRAVGELSAALAHWLSCRSPRFPLRVLFAGPTSSGKELLATAVADLLFEKKIVVHGRTGESLPQAVDDGFGRLGGGPVVLFLKWFDDWKHALLGVEMLLEAGGMVLGNGRSANLADSVIVMSASQRLSEKLLAAPPWEEAAAAEFPWLAGAVDVFAPFGELGTRELADIVRLTTQEVSRRAGFPVLVTDAVAAAIAARCRLARFLDHELSDVVTSAWSRDPAGFSRRRDAHVPLHVDHDGSGFVLRWMDANRVELAEGRDRRLVAPRHDP